MRSRLILAVVCLGCSVWVGPLLQPAAAEASVSFKEFVVPTANSSPQHMGLGPDHNVWFTERDAGKIARVTPDGTITEFAVPTLNSAPDHITAGSDGNIWFTERDANKIGMLKIPPDSGCASPPCFTEFPTPAASGNTHPLDIALGPDGNLWFAENQTSSIGRITTSGTITEFTTPTASSGPNGITLGPDGNMWFTENGANNIGRITMAGQITEFPSPTPNANSDGIAVGGDGNIWFPEANSSKIGRITTTGQVTEFPLHASSGPRHIIRGADGNIWFTEENSTKIGRITPSGTITEFPVPTPASLPHGIVAAPDGSVWFTERDPSANKVVRVLIPLKLTVKKKGKGAVTSSPAGISCGAACSNTYSSTKVVTLKEKPARGWHFVKWTGACSGKKGCAVTMSANRTVKAVFAKA